jgi:hypothetical protein
MYLIQLAFAGAWAYVFHWGTGVALIALCLLGAYGTQFFALIPVIGPWLVKQLGFLRKDLVWAAVAVAVAMGGMYVGNKDATARCVAKENIVVKQVHKIVKESEKPSTRPDKWDITK